MARTKPGKRSARETAEVYTHPEHRQIAVKVIDDRGTELLVVKPLD
jgi:hypothetical protein